MNAVLIINENDTVAVDELMLTFGDNDRLAALVTNAIRAPLLVILSDVDGLYDGHPGSRGQQVIPIVRRVDNSVEQLANDKANGLSRGGMRSKLEAARAVTKSGENMIIASAANRTFWFGCWQANRSALLSGGRESREFI